jgi:hypothetical protein
MLRGFQLDLYYAEMFISSTLVGSRNCGGGCVHVGIPAGKLRVFNFRLEEANSL